MNTTIQTKKKDNNLISKNKIEIVKKHNTYLFFKRIMDIFFGLFGVILLIPLTLIIYILRKVFKEDDGSLFYDQLRIGKNGKHFKIYKYRTMVVGADEILKKYLKENKEAKKEFEKNQKLKNDPRITKLGRFLRATSLDEMPQFINVLKGDMSLIGPRPIVDREVPLFGDKINIVHRVRPGITGYWAANGRSNTTYEDRVNMETFYAENCSLKLDIKIFFKTIYTVLTRGGCLLSKTVRDVVKRITDILFSLIGIIIIIPLTIIIYIANKILKEDNGPIFYTQLRIGKNGKYFKLYKYRTMVVGADEILEKYLNQNEKAREDYAKYKKLKNDPRITKVGNILRKTSLDEFPQFINVLLGNMSLVGPRPYLPREKKDMGEYYRKIILCKPGITGWWQINGRSNTTFEERLEKDKYYVENRTILLDFKIIIKTILQVILKKGAF